MDRSFEVFMGRCQNEYSRESMRRRMEWLCGHAQGRVLDVGCSQGLLPWLLGHKGVPVVGIDCDAEAIAWAQDNLQHADPAARENITLLCADFLSYTPEQEFDTIIAGEYLEHLPDDLMDRHLAHMGQLLAPSGHVVITVPLGLHPHPDHYQIFLPSTLTAKIGKHFSLLHMDAEDAYLRCIGDLSSSRRTISPERQLELAEKGLIQLQKKAAAGKRATKVVELQGKGTGTVLQKKDTIEPYLRGGNTHCPPNTLTEQLAAKGLLPPFIYDRYLFTTLNDIYRDTPLVPQPRELTPQGLYAVADRRLNNLFRIIGDIEGLNCLEIGCGRGETAVRLAERGNCRVTGVDLFSYPEWPERQNEQVRLMDVDLTAGNPFKTGTFDRIVSFSVLEHVQRPLAMLEAMFTLLKTGGLAFFSANLYRGPRASHRYREVFFPWPHLLFEDAVFMRFYRDLDGRQGIKPAWVNKLTHLHYLEKVRSLGFEVLKCTYSTKPFDQDFYECFIDKLGRYPREDLEKDFINLTLRKPKFSS